MFSRAPSEIILSQGRLADRTPGAIAGAAALAAALSRRFGARITTVGQPAPAQQDGWEAALAAAKPTLDGLAFATGEALRAGRRVVLVNNTCSASLATLPVAARAVKDLAVLWIDAHADYNTPDTTASGYLGGMALAGASGLWDSGYGQGVAPSRSLFPGLRDIDPAEQALIARHEASVLPPADVAAAPVLDWLGDRPVWVHIDWDVMEPGLVPAAYAVPGGLLPRQLQAVLEALPLLQIVGLELAEFELPADPGASENAISTMLDILTPLLARVFSETPASADSRA